MKEKQSGKVASERENMLKELATAYDIYMELLANLQEGTKVMLSLFIFFNVNFFLIFLIFLIF